MPKNQKQILSDVLALSPIERAELVESILTSFEFSSREEIDVLWAQEAEDRIDAFERGEISTTSAQDVFSKLNR
jgi:putative addiction module component (TIGR02574 family)